jgi:RHS repeat-associated protein
VDGGRIKRNVGTFGETWMIYGFDGELIAEYAAPNGVNPKPSAPTTEYAYRAGEMLIQADASDCKWLVSDHLGSPRIILGTSGSLADTKRRDFMPFGEDLGAGQFGRTTAQGYEPSGTPSNPREKFATYERDDETGLDFAQARYYQNRLGRFTSPDDILTDQHVQSPQTWNLYTYSGNNPIRCFDPTGMWVRTASDNGEYWLAEKGDTWQGLADLTGLSADTLAREFGNTVQVGANYDIGSFRNASQSTPIMVMGFVTAVAEAPMPVKGLAGPRSPLIPTSPNEGLAGRAIGPVGQAGTFLALFFGLFNQELSSTYDQPYSSEGTASKAKKCQTAKKLLEQYERLAKKLGKTISPSRIQELDRLRDSGQIKKSDLPGFLHSQFPNDFDGKTLSEINKECANVR